MFGHGWPDRGPWPGAGAPCGAAEPAGGCVEELVAVCVVVVAALVEPGAADETAIPPSAPAEASVPVISATLTALEDIIGMNLLVGFWGTPTMLDPPRKELARDV